MSKHRHRPVKRDEPRDKSQAAHDRVDNYCERYNTAALEDRYGLVDNLVGAVMLQESEGRPSAQSGMNCIGLMQVAPGTARMMGVGRGMSDEALIRHLKLHPEVNVQVGAKYLGYVARELDEDNRRYQAQGGGLSFDIIKDGQLTEQGAALVIAAYNCGPGAWPNRKGSTRGVAPKIALYGDRWYDRLPAETHNYVLDIMSRMGLEPPRRGVAYSGREEPDPAAAPALDAASTLPAAPAAPAPSAAAAQPAAAAPAPAPNPAPAPAAPAATPVPAATPARVVASTPAPNPAPAPAATPVPTATPARAAAPVVTPTPTAAPTPPAATNIPPADPQIWAQLRQINAQYGTSDPAAVDGVLRADGGLMKHVDTKLTTLGYSNWPDFEKDREKVVPGVVADNKMVVLEVGLLMASRIPKTPSNGNGRN